MLFSDKLPVHIRALSCSNPQRFTVLPLGDGAVVSREEHLRYPAPVPFLRAGVLRELQQSVVVALDAVGVLIRKHPGLEPRHSVRDYQRGKLTAGQHIISDRQLLHFKLVQHALIYALVVAAQQDKPRLLREFLHLLLGQHLALRGHVDYPGFALTLGLYRGNAVVNRLSLHEHSGAAAVGLVVNAAVLVFGVFPDIVGVHLDKAVSDSPADYALVKHAAAHLSEQRCNVDSHSPSPSTASSNSPGSGLMIISPASMSVLSTTSSIHGNISSVPSSLRMEYTSLAPFW